MLVTGDLMARISPSRRIAFEVLAAVENGAYASDTLRRRGRMLDSRDAGLASHLVFGCLRFRAQLDHLIFVYSGRRSAELDEAVAIALRMGIFQLRYLERIPRHAAVHETVELVKQQVRKASGFANAVLRKVDKKPVVWPDLATELSCPAWMLERWAMQFGATEARRIAEAALREPAAYVRVPPGAELPEGANAEVTEIAGCLRLLSPTNSGMRLHDISSQAMLPLLGLQAGNSYLDLCAAPGNKTLQALETPLSLAVACDISVRRIRDIPPVCPRVVLDAARPLPFSRRFDRIFIDAPCSGTGTLGRNPEIKWRVQQRDFARFGELQGRILGEGLRHLAPEGKLLYATCSLEREENEEVVSKALELWPEFRCEREMRRVPGRDPGDGFYGALLSRR